MSYFDKIFGRLGREKEDGVKDSEELGFFRVGVRFILFAVRIRVVFMGWGVLDSWFGGFVVEIRVMELLDKGIGLWLLILGCRGNMG